MTINLQDLNALTDVWWSTTSWLNDKIGEQIKGTQDQAYALGLKRGKKLTHLSDEEILKVAEPFGAFQNADAQGHARLEFARAVLAAAYNKLED